MPLLKTDDEARHVPSVWLGDPSVGRVPFDASYSQWILGFMLLLPTLGVLGLLVPVIVWAGLISWYFGKFIANRMSRKFDAVDRTSRILLSAWSWRTVALLFFVLILPDPFAWILPLNIIAAILVTPIAVFLLVRRYSKFITPMTPVTYWLGVLWHIITRPRTPRIASAERTIGTEIDESEFDLAELEGK